jgi:hypothetical protein
METNIEIEYTLTEVTDSREVIVPMQELVANPVTYRFERSMAEILAERAAEAGYRLAVPLFIP